MKYREFIQSKKTEFASVGFDFKTVNNGLFDFQQHIVKWALKKGLWIK
jgi:hypothetical protein